MASAVVSRGTRTKEGVTARRIATQLSTVWTNARPGTIGGLQECAFGNIGALFGADSQMKLKLCCRISSDPANF